jgi:hypothetical protein
MLNKLVVVLTVLFSLVSMSIASAADAKFIKNPGWGEMLMYNEKSPVKFFGRNAKDLACAVAPTFTVGISNIVRDCSKFIDTKFAAPSFCGGQPYKVKVDGKGANFVYCVPKSFPIVVNGVTYVDADGKVVQR